MRNNDRNNQRNKNNNATKDFFAYAIAITFAICLAGIVTFQLYLFTLPPISQLSDYNPSFVSQIISSDGVTLKTFGAYKSEKIKPEEMPDVLKHAIIAIEDKNFYHHQGYDPIALVRSSFINFKAGHVVQGASTITQQLARILFLSNVRTYDRKVKELIISHRIEKSISKDEILGMYLNNVYLGEGAYGVSAAADIYFNKKVGQLTLSEAALIAGLPQAPSVYSPYQNMDLAIQRRDMVLKRMYAERYITKDELNAALKDKIHIRHEYVTYSNNKAPYYADYVVRELQQLGFTEEEISQGGYKIYTTLNYEYQKVAQEAIYRNLSAWGLNKPYQQSALLSYDAVTGKILAYVGGKDYSKSQFDRVTQSVRQPGSAFKVFVYTAAVEQGLNPNAIYEDTPYRLAEWAPHNYGNKYRGKIPVYTALAFSSNAVAARIIMDSGVNETIMLARRLGISTPIEKDPTIALGSSGVKLYEITNAYGVLANGGILVKPYSIERIETANGEVVYEATNTYRRVLDLDTVSKMVSMMKLVLTKGTGRAADIGRPAAGKTGTTDSYRDAWFIGFTPDIVTGVWVGNDNNTPTPKLTGGSVPAKIWSQYMKFATKDTPPNDFPYPKFELGDQKALSTEEAPTEEMNTDIKPVPPTPQQGQDEQRNTIQQQDYNTQPEDGMQQPVPVPARPPVPAATSGTY